VRADSFIAAAALLGAAFCIYLASPFLPAVLGALVLSIVFTPIVDRLEHATGRRWLAATIGVAMVFVLILIPAMGIANAATRELRDVYGQLNARSNAEGGWLALLGTVATPAFDWVSMRTGIPADELRSALLERLSSVGGALLRSTTAVAAGLTEAIVQLVVAIMTLFFLLRDGDGIVRHIRGNSPLSPAQTDELLSSTAASVTANVYGVLGVAAAQGLLAGVGYWIVDLPSPVLWGLVTGLFSMVPLVGSGMVWAPAAILLTAGGAWGRGLILVAWGAGVVSMSDNFVRPWIIGQRTNSNTLLVFFALLGGAKLFGLAGLFIGPVALSVTAVLFKFWSSASGSLVLPDRDRADRERAG
jgi:predicted PurR-regulated permease PerM